jgi:chromate reductase, NAD(P)H dehydrogenase (quinone)
MHSRPARQWIFAISGSLRRDSYNSAALRAAAEVASPRTVVAIDNTVRFLPQFNPDLERRPPRSVRRFRLACNAATAVLLSIPEYAHGVPGAVKNALDWTVSDGCFDGKRVAVLNVAAPGRGRHAEAALRSVLEALGSDVEYHALPLSRRLPARVQLRDPQNASQLRQIVNSLVGTNR